VTRADYDGLVSATTEDVIAVIPAYQAAPTLDAVVRDTARHVPVLVVDDGSTDETSSVAREAGAEVLRQPANQGKGAADFLAAWRERGAPLIIGRRDFSKMPLSRRIANTLGTWVFSRAVGRHIEDNQSGYRLIARPLLPHLLHSSEDGFEFEVEMITDAIRAGLDIDWVPIPTIYDDAGSHISPVSHVTNFLRVARAARRSVGTPLDLDAGE
jgi:glycosyltransferase involved in cell wall biosynthesis